MVASLLLNCPSSLYENLDETEDHISLCTLKIFDSSVNEVNEKYYPKFRTELLQEYNSQNLGPYVLVEVTNHREASLLKNEKIANILNTLYLKFKFTVLISAMDKDRERAEELKAILEMPSEVGISKNLDGFLSFLNKADICMVGDGGLGHIAAAMDKVLLSLHGKTSVNHWKPLGNNVVTMYDPENINNITDEDIIEAMIPLLSKIHR